MAPLHSINEEENNLLAGVGSFLLAGQEVDGSLSTANTDAEGVDCLLSLDSQANEAVERS